MSANRATRRFVADVARPTIPAIVDPITISAQTEVWLDVTIDETGDATAVSHVPFAVVPGQRSVVIHAVATDPDTGLAGPRLACLPVEWTP